MIQAVQHVLGISPLVETGCLLLGGRNVPRLLVEIDQAQHMVGIDQKASRAKRDQAHHENHDIDDEALLPFSVSASLKSTGNRPFSAHNIIPCFKMFQTGESPALDYFRQFFSLNIRPFFCYNIF